MGCQVVNIYGGHKRMKFLFRVQSDIFWHQNPLVMVVVQFQFGRALSRWSALKCGLALRRDSMQIVFRGSAFIVSNINNFQIKCSLPWVCFSVLSSCSVSLVKCIMTLVKSTCFFPWHMFPCIGRFCRPSAAQLPLSLCKRQKQQEVAPGSCSRGMSLPKWVLRLQGHAVLGELWWDNILPCSWKAQPDHAPAPAQICSAQSKLMRFFQGFSERWCHCWHPAEMPSLGGLLCSSSSTAMHTNISEVTLPWRFLGQWSLFLWKTKVTLYCSNCVHLAAKTIKKQQQNSPEGSGEGEIITEKGI